MERDLPALVRDIAKSFNDIEISVTPPLDGHPALVQILHDRVVDALG
jgi:sirohydrochlorin ferrochelatase